MFFEASSIGYRKTIFDVTKFTYNMYSCEKYCMSREMMEMDGLDSAKWQKSIGKDINGLLGKFNEEDDKIVYSGHLPPSKRRQIGWNLWERCRAWVL